MPPLADGEFVPRVDDGEVIAIYAEIGRWAARCGRALHIVCRDGPRAELIFGQLVRYSDFECRWLTDPVLGESGSIDSPYLADAVVSQVEPAALDFLYDTLHREPDERTHQRDLVVIDGAETMTIDRGTWSVEARGPRDEVIDRVRYCEFFAQYQHVCGTVTSRESVAMVRERLANAGHGASVSPDRVTPSSHLAAARHEASAIEFRQRGALVAFRQDLLDLVVSEEGLEEVVARWIEAVVGARTVEKRYAADVVRALGGNFDVAIQGASADGLRARANARLTASIAQKGLPDFVAVAKSAGSRVVPSRWRGHLSALDELALEFRVMKPHAGMLEYAERTHRLYSDMIARIYCDVLYWIGH